MEQAHDSHVHTSTLWLPLQPLPVQPGMSVSAALVLQNRADPNGHFMKERKMPCRIRSGQRRHANHSVADCFMEQHMSSHETRITVGVAKHVLIGALPLAGSRIQERLNDSRTDAVTLTDVEVCSHVNRQCVARLPQAVVPKAQIEYLLIPTNQHEAPQKRWNNHTRKKVFSTFATVSDCSASGDLHLPADPADGWYTLSQQLPRFFAITDASFRGFSGEQLHVSLVIANKDYVTCFHVGSPVALDRPGAKLQGDLATTCP